MLRHWLTFCSFVALTGCASVVNGTSQSLTVQTVMNGALVESANCQLTNTRGSWRLTTPGTVIVHRSYSALTVSCSKNGYQIATETVNSASSTTAFGDNLILGGAVGMGIDMTSGAAYDYPSLITVPMQLGTPVASDAQTVLASKK